MRADLSEHGVLVVNLHVGVLTEVSVPPGPTAL